MPELKDENKQSIIGAVEAILFVHGEPMSTEKIAKTLSNRRIFGKIGKEEVKHALEEWTQELKNEKRGLALIFSKLPSGGEEVQLVTRPELGSLIPDFVKEEFKESLSPASLESLALILYLGPLSRAEIDFYRGVNSSFIVRSLLMRGLIARNPDPQRTNVYLYQPSFDLLGHLGISKIEELPEYHKYKDMAHQTTPEEQPPTR